MKQKPSWTPEEYARVDALLETMSQREAAEKLGITLKGLERRLCTRRRRQLAGPSGNPAATTFAHVHAGLQLKGQSALVNADGKLAQRWDKSGAARAEPTPVPPHFALRKVSQFTDATGMIAEWRQYSPEAAARYEALRDAIRASAAEYCRPVAPIAAPANTSDDTLTVYPIGDPHIGMLAWAAECGESFDLKIATRELTECMVQLVHRSPPSKRAIVANLGDFFHAQDQRNVTPGSGHSLDVDGRFGKVARVGVDLMRAVIDAALAKHEHVSVRNVRGNHDPDASLWIPEVMRAWYHDEPRVTIEDAHRFYQFDLFGRNLILWAHGNGAKPEKLPEVMLTYAAELVSQTRFRFAYTGHVHSKHSAEFGGLLWESFNTLAGKDAWHAMKGYGSLQRLQAITLHRDWGEDSRVTVGVERVRAAIGRAA